MPNRTMGRAEWRALHRQRRLNGAGAYIFWGIAPDPIGFARAGRITWWSWLSCLRRNGDADSAHAYLAHMRRELGVNR